MIRAYVLMPDGERVGPFTRYVVQDVRRTLSQETEQLLTIEYEEG